MTEQQKMAESHLSRWGSPERDAEVRAGSSRMSGILEVVSTVDRETWVEPGDGNQAGVSG